MFLNIYFRNDTSLSSEKLCISLPQKTNPLALALSLALAQCTLLKKLNIKIHCHPLIKVHYYDSVILYNLEC